MIQINKESYIKLIEEDIKYIKSQFAGLEQSHIIQVLELSIDLFYPENKIIFPTQVEITIFANNLSKYSNIYGNFIDNEKTSNIIIGANWAIERIKTQI